jgi:hypothetical protein
VPGDGDDEEENARPPVLKVVSDNPNAYADRELAYAKSEAERSLAEFAASLLRVAAGSNSESVWFMRKLSAFIDAQRSLYRASGETLRPADLERALRMPDVDYSQTGYWSERRHIREHGMELIVQGALRLAAHQLLNEQPAFGGMHSERVIMDGIKTLEELKRPAPPPPNRKEPASWENLDIDPAKSQSATKRKSSKEFDYQDLKELRKAIKANDKKKIAELTSKIRPPSEKG